MKKLSIFWFIAPLAALLMVTCGKKEVAEFETLSQAQVDSIRQVVQEDEREPLQPGEIAVMETNYGTIYIEFFPEVAPTHAANFKHLANHGYYDGTWFHRVIEGFMIQGGDILSRDGDPSNDGTGGPGYTIPAEFSDLPHYRGRLSMARSQDPNSAGSQFFIVQNPDVDKEMLDNVELRKNFTYADSVRQNYQEEGGYPHLDRDYTVFGEVIKGMDVVDEIAALPTNDRDRPQEKAIMEQVRVTDRSEVNL